MEVYIFLTCLLLDFVHMVAREKKAYAVLQLSKYYPLKSLINFIIFFKGW